MISVVIPTYKSPSSLDLCLKSAIKGQIHNNEIIVVVDGTYEINEEILQRYSEHISVLRLDENVGTCKATNLGVYNSSNETILIVNDDNVFPQDWDVALIEIGEDTIKKSVVAPNQIEPYNSMFRQFIIKDMGKNPAEFNLEEFWKYEKSIRKESIEECGSTFPIFITKFNFLKVGGFDSDYPSQAGHVADWDFFMKCEMSGLKMIRTHNSNFYHFVSVSSKSEEQLQTAKEDEINCHYYFKYKWGCGTQHNPINNSKMISKYKI